MPTRITLRARLPALVAGLAVLLAATGGLGVLSLQRRPRPSPGTGAKRARVALGDFAPHTGALRH